MALSHVVMDTCCLTDEGEYKSNATANSAVQITSIDGFFNRKRGRPPKNRFVEVYKSAQETPQAIFTSFKLERLDASAPTNPYGQTAPEASLDISTAAASCFSPVNSSRVHQTLIKTKKRIVPKITTSSIVKTLTTKTTPTIINTSIVATTATTRTTSVAAAAASAAHIAATITTTATSTASLPTKQSKLIQKYQRMKQREEPAYTTTTIAATTNTTTAAAAAEITTTTTTRGLKTTNTKEISCRKSTTTSQINSIELESDSKSFLDQWHKLRESSEQTHVQILIGNRNIIKDENTSVRATGTFYPENSLYPSNVHHVKLSTMFNTNKTCKLNPKLRRESPMSADLADGTDEPEDLSSKTKGEHASAYAACRQESIDTEQATCLRLLQFNQLLAGYQQQLPGFMQSLLTQAFQPPAVNSDYNTPNTAGLFTSVDLCALLENSAKQTALLATANGQLDAHSGAAARKTHGHSIPLIGYLKFRFNEDCGFPQCGYRKHQTHFHCNRNDCHYSFCDKTRFVQHTARHERLDSLMGDDFQQFRANVTCRHATCHFATGTSYEAQTGAPALKKSSHFHCRKCDYVCTDTNKVVAHRRLHGKMELIRSAGFCKVANNEHCPEAACLYAFKHTHYHCLICDYSVLSRTQLVAHKHRASPAGTKRGTKVIALTTDN